MQLLSPQKISPQPVRANLRSRLRLQAEEIQIRLFTAHKIQKRSKLEKVNGVVVGGGVVGLAVARGLAQAASSNAKEWYLLEAEDAIGTGISSRNSEVIHAGIYYPQGSLKAKLCVQGRGLLYDYAIERGVAHKRCGKLIVATNPKQLQTLTNIQKNALANGINDLVWLTAKQAMQMEPALFCVAALHSPSTGIVDSRGLMLNLQGDFENVGGVVALNSQVVSARHTDNGFIISMADGTKLLADVLINAAGLNAPWLAHKIDGLKKDFVPKAFFAKGNYFALTGRAPFSHLIYPVPEVSGLGVHLTLDLGGQAKFGPDVQWVKSPNDLNVSTELEPVFYEEVRKYWPTLTDGALTPSFAGIRPKISGPHETPADFCIQGPATHGLRGLVNLFGIESPGLTSSLAIAGAVVKALET